MEAFQRLPVWSRKGYVTADIPSRASRFETSQYVTLCQLLVFDADGRVCEDSPLSEDFYRPPWKRQARCSRERLSGH
jgi:hypothetical protein